MTFRYPDYFWEIVCGAAACAFDRDVLPHLQDTDEVHAYRAPRWAYDGRTITILAGSGPGRRVWDYFPQHEQWRLATDLV